MPDASEKEDDEGKVQIRHARREDVPTILHLIQELAAYEKESDAVEATPALLLQTIAFGPPPLPNTTTASTPSSRPPDAPVSAARPARCLLLFAPDGGPAGMALYFYNYSTWKARPGIYLEDLFVREEHRGRGYGQRLLAELAREVVAMDGGRLEWCVLKWNAPSIGFYESGRVGARAMSEWQTMRVDGEALTRLAERAG